MARRLLMPLVDAADSRRIDQGSPPMSRREELQTIDPAALAQVSGGATTTPGTSTSNATSEQLLTALTGVLDSLQSLTTQRNGGFNQQEMILLMMVMQQRQQQNAAAAAAAAAWWTQEPVIRYY
jgi:hypothetical protein